MSMLFYALLLCLASWSVDARIDYAGSIRPLTYTYWGNWGNEDWCDEGFYAYGFELKAEEKQPRRHDDTALNGIKLLCKNYCTGITQDVTSTIGRWGSWGNTIVCEADYFLHGAQARSEKPQPANVGGDNTAVNNYNFLCKNTKNTANTQILYGDGMSWGSWSTNRDCPYGSYICGIKTQVEPNQDDKDDTALNDAIFYCCKLKKPQCNKHSTGTV